MAALRSMVTAFVGTVSHPLRSSAAGDPSTDQHPRDVMEGMDGHIDPPRSG